MVDQIAYHHASLEEGVSQMQGVNRSINDAARDLEQDTLKSAEHWQTPESSENYKLLSNKLNRQLEAASSIVAALATSVQTGSQDIQAKDRKLAQQF
jgi:uncharacterized protein YukE